MQRQRSAHGGAMARNGAYREGRPAVSRGGPCKADTACGPGQKAAPAASREAATHSRVAGHQIRRGDGCVLFRKMPAARDTTRFIRHGAMRSQELASQKAAQPPTDRGPQRQRFRSGRSGRPERARSGPGSTPTLTRNRRGRNAGWPLDCTAPSPISGPPAFADIHS